MEDKTYKLRFRAVNSDIFEAIRTGSKRVETRAATVKYRDIKIGDVLRFMCGNKHFEKKVTKVKVFKTITEMLKKYKAKEINLGVSSNKELRETYYSFPGYKEKINKCGLIAMELE
jgi:ASC-1-like (ASCH) protein